MDGNFFICAKMHLSVRNVRNAQCAYGNNFISLSIYDDRSAPR